MNREEKLLVAVCQSYFCQNNLLLPDGIDWKKFYSLARHHNLTGICHCVFNAGKELDIPQNIRRLFTDSFLDLVYRYEMQSAALGEIEEGLGSGGIPFITFKGAVLRGLYPVAESRSMGDIDILISEKDREKSDEILTSMGFELYSYDGAVKEYVKNGVLLEVHTRLFSQPCGVFDDAFDNADFLQGKGQLDDSFHFAYLIAHTANHLKYTGAGIRFVLDLAVMQRERQIDFNRVFEILEGVGLAKFARAILSVCFEWFGTGEKYTEDTQRLQRYLVEDGVFGSLKTDGEAAVSRLVQCEAFDERGKGRSPLRLKLRLAFPPYETLVKAPYIKFLQGRRWLLPAAWIYRFFYSLKNNRKHMLNTVKNIDDKKTAELVDEKLAFFEEIGLK